MSAIGKFQSAGAEIVGEIYTIDIQLQNVRLVREENPANDDAPSHRIYAGRAEIGAAWTKASRENRPYLSLKLDDPSFKAPIFATLFQDEPGEYTLVWSRSRT
ncbi:DUF736 domain-containing protein [Asticcacaulis benevestitus]|uniref:DUF736 domain-containing protein n=1 Tax=Asticcacaulis benevestitus DSM 16100 = ATCC BAA-896 TaxID=1121022 RepID=V4R6D8_9CAUL|nr:DUF736 domain-containing protein [Asticcacaulis benevestitus]ESQ87038.1 hypothetical protein ABENE_17570 [Asticcacaulis benevestitus DSM 16100 = ATCC BAA-896]